MARNNSSNTINRPAAAVKTEVNGKEKTVLRKDVCVRKKEGATEHCYNIIYDFKNVSYEQLLEWASQSLNIRVQSNLRSLTEEALTALEQTNPIKVDASNPAAILKNDSVKQAEEEAKLRETVAKMGDADFDNLMALMNERMAARQAQNNQ